MDQPDLGVNVAGGAVEGYCGRRSYAPGDIVEVHCSGRARSFTAEVARVGTGRDVVWRREGIPCQERPVPERASTHGCAWPATFTFRVGEGWASGCYELAVTADDGRAAGTSRYAPFAVRSRRGDEASILLVLSTNTYNAYNRWGGECLYTGASQVSFARPLEEGYVVKPVDPDGFDGRFATSEPDGDPEHQRLSRYLDTHGLSMWTSSAGWWNWERRFVRWAERSGYRIDVAVNSDLEDYPDVLAGRRLVVSVGHDEYWSWGMRDTVDDFVDRGGNVAFFGGNSLAWQVRFEDGGQTMVCHRQAAVEHDPVMATSDRSRLTSLWSDPRIGRPENLTTGLSFWRGGYVRIGHAVPRSPGAYTVHRPDHWAFAGTGLRYGDLLGRRSRPVGYEVDGCALAMHDGLPVPTHEDATPDGFEVLATSPARLISITRDECEAPVRYWASVDPPGELQFAALRLFGDVSDTSVRRLAHNHAVLGIFTRGGTVFNAGTADWAYGLDEDADVQRVTANVLDRLGT